MPVSERTLARKAGFLYLLVALIAPIGLIYVPNKLFDLHNAAATAAAIRSSESLLRIGIASELTHQAIEVFLVLALYRLFVSVDENAAKLLAILGLLPIPIVFLNTTNEIAAILLAKPAEFLNIFPQPQLDALSQLFVRLHSYGLQAAGVFWGLWLFPFGYLTIKSNFIPKILGYALFASGIGYLAGSTTAFVFPQYREIVSTYTAILGFGELFMILWLVIFGARPRSVVAT